ncbi:MAG: hypothetical protein HN350_02885 [Phycisphaerales bacterium]|jgi:hypothetical protein|nr:hypothetical protein [Phycisphaerales bacterium]
MITKRAKLLSAGVVCMLAIASICIVAPGAAKKAPARKKRPKRVDVALKIGQLAPDFELYTLEHAVAMKAKPTAKPTSQPATQPAKGKIKLSSFRGKQPVYLIFASYT